MNRGTCGTVCTSRFLRSPTLRGFLHLRADGLRVGQFAYDLRDVRSSVDAGDGSPRGADSQLIREVDGDGRRPRAFFAKSNRLGSTVQRSPLECFGDWIPSG